MRVAVAERRDHVAVIEQRVEVAHAVVEPAIGAGVERAVAGEHLDRIEAERERRRPLHAVPAGTVVERRHAKPRVVDLDHRVVRDRRRGREELCRARMDQRARRGATVRRLRLVDDHRIDADVELLARELVRRDRRHPIVEIQLLDLVVQVAVDVVIGQADHLDATGDLRDHALRIREPGVVRRVRVDVQIRRHRPVRPPRALERDRELDLAPIGREIDLALPALELDAAPRPDLVATVRDRGRRCAGIAADRHLGEAVREDQAVHDAMTPGAIGHAVAAWRRS